MLTLVTMCSVVGYIARVNLTVSGHFIRDEFHLSDKDIGWALTVFLLSYTFGQVPSGLLIDRFGARRVLVAAGLSWFSVTATLAWFIGYVADSRAQVVTALIASRLLLGLAEAPTYPACAKIIAQWFPSEERGLPNSFVQGGAFFGEALTLIIVSSTTVIIGWRLSLDLTALPALVAAVALWWWGRDGGGVREAERASVADRRQSAASTSQGSTTAAPDTISTTTLAILSAGYFLQGYVAYLFFFWFYAYLVDARHFSIAAGGIVGSLPIASAAACALAGGWLSDAVVRRQGAVRGRRNLVVVAALVGGASVLVGAFSVNAIIAIGGFIVALGTIGFVQAPFWALLSDLAGERVGFAGGVMNGACNLGGAISTVAAPLLAARLGWNAAMVVGAAACAISGMALLPLGPRR